jgi:hypothetical protein
VTGVRYPNIYKYTAFYRYGPLPRGRGTHAQQTYLHALQRPQPSEGKKMPSMQLETPAR